MDLLDLLLEGVFFHTFYLYPCSIIYYILYIKKIKRIYPIKGYKHNAYIV
uniref:TLC domain-containing protein n=1 Tax=viral metagenome TaxID=1070528 RepID=A0A6C0KBA0_9ZZZZ